MIRFNYDTKDAVRRIVKMKADNAFLMALVGKLTEIMENTTDMDTANELSEFIDVILDRMR